MSQRERDVLLLRERTRIMQVLPKNKKIDKASDPPKKKEKKNAYIILEWWFVSICILYCIRFKLLKQNSVPCSSLSSNSRIYLTYFLKYVLWPKTSAIFYNLKSHLQVDKNSDSLHKHFASRPPAPKTK